MSWKQRPDWRDPGIRENPFPAYQHCHAYGRPYYAPEDDAWYVFSAQDVEKVLKDSSSSVNRFGHYLKRLPLELQQELGPFFRHIGRWMTFRDDQDHSSLRRPVQRAFDSRILQQWERWLEVAAAGILEPLCTQPEFDFMSEVAVPIPLLLIAEMLGIPQEDCSRIKAEYLSLTDFFDNVSDPAILKRAVLSEHKLRTYLQQHLQAFRDTPAENLMTILLGLQATNPALTDEDLAANAILLLGAGHETTTSMLCSSVELLFQSEEHIARAATDPEFVDLVIEEALRLHAPLQRTSRLLRAELILGGVCIPAGSRVCVMLGAANRDPVRFENPDEAVFGRKNRHFSFSSGPHFCAGARVAKLEGQVVLRQLSQLFPTHQQKTPIKWQQNLTFRTPVSLYLSRSLENSP